MALSIPQAIECFHLAFLSVLARQVGESGFVLKGGANLRYFFGSERYSEDIDLDVVRLKAWQIHEKVERAIESRNLALLLRADSLVVEEHTSPKQTETTQRWKVAVSAIGMNDPVRTKVEFSHRDLDSRFSLDAVPEAAVARYAIRPPRVQHYLADAAIEQKILALAGRSETQARDVFDLEMLFRRTGLAASGVSASTLALASERTIELPFEAYRDQVLPFLEPGAAEMVNRPEDWEQMQTFVAGKLEESDGGR